MRMGFCCAAHGKTPRASPLQAKGRGVRQSAYSEVNRRMRLGRSRKTLERALLALLGGVFYFFAALLDVLAGTPEGVAAGEGYGKSEGDGNQRGNFLHDGSPEVVEKGGPIPDLRCTTYRRPIANPVSQDAKKLPEGSFPQ